MSGVAVPEPLLPSAPLPRARDESEPLTLETLWTDQGFDPNPQQQEAIRAESGPLYLTAGPGSGKTSVFWAPLQRKVPTSFVNDCAGF